MNNIGYKFKLLERFGYITKTHEKNEYRVCRYLPIFNPSSIHSLNDYVEMLVTFTKSEILENFNTLFPKDELFKELEKRIETKETCGFRKEEFEPTTTYWYSQNGEILVSEMGNSHLKNAWKYFTEKRTIEEVQEYYEALSREAFYDEVDGNEMFFKTDPSQFLHTEAYSIKKKGEQIVKGLLAIREELHRRNLSV
jgi:hypothetical protein